MESSCDRSLVVVVVMERNLRFHSRRKMVDIKPRGIDDVPMVTLATLFATNPAAGTLIWSASFTASSPISSGCPARARSPPLAAQAARCWSRSIRPAWPAPASPWRTCATRCSRPSGHGGRRAASGAR